ncbi:MAG: AraC family transcriptional regulator [Lachnospiraceae bacterium]|nr:AraC family transcriptional regulator [Lachnospiraceae bacterium]
MPFPMPADTNFSIVKRSLASDYAMPTLEAASDYYEIGYQISGDRMTITPDCSFALRANMVGTMPPYIYHRTLPLSDVPYISYLVKFRPEFVRPLTDALGQNVLDEIYSQLFNRFAPSIRSRILLYFQEMHELFESNSFFKDFRLQCMLCDLLLAVLNNRLPNDAADGMHQNTGGQMIHKTPLSPSIIDAIYYMEQHYQETPSLETVAQLSGYSASHFSRLFHAQLGKPYSEYLTRIRIRHAQDLLLNTKKSVTEIALETGYLHTGNLSEQFKQQTGMTPLQYRKANAYTPALP